MATKDTSAELSVAASLVPAARDADADGTGVDLQGYESALVVASLGAEGVTLSGTDKITIELEHSDDNVTYTDCAAADTIGEESAGVIKTLDANAECPGVYAVAYVGAKRYVRAVANFAGTHGAATPLEALVVRGHKRHQS